MQKKSRSYNIKSSFRVYIQEDIYSTSEKLHLLYILEY